MVVLRYGRYYEGDVSGRSGGSGSGSVGVGSGASGIFSIVLSDLMKMARKRERRKGGKTRKGHTYSGML